MFFSIQQIMPIAVSKSKLLKYQIQILPPTWWLNKYIYFTVKFEVNITFKHTTLINNTTLQQHNSHNLSHITRILSNLLPSGRQSASNWSAQAQLMISRYDFSHHGMVHSKSATCLLKIISRDQALKHWRHGSRKFIEFTLNLGQWHDILNGRRF